MPSSAPPSAELYFETIQGFQRSAALKAAIELELFTAIGDGARTAAEIGSVCDASERAIRMLCDFLTSVGFVTKSGAGYALTPDSAAFLTRRSPAYLGGTAEFLYSADVARAFDSLTETIRHDGPRANFVSDENPAWVRFAHAMTPVMMPAAQAIAALLDAPSAGPMRVLDIAAGHGIFGIVLARENPRAEITAIDWAPVLQVASDNANKMGVGARHRSIAGNAFTVEFGHEFDVALVTNFVHHFDRQTNVAFLKRTCDALKPGGRVVVLEFVPNADRVTPPTAARFCLSMLALTPRGEAYTFDELQGMLTEAGFGHVTAHASQGAETILLGTKR